MVEELAATAGAMQTQASGVADAVAVFRLSTNDRGASAADAVALRRAHKQEARAAA